MKKLLMSTLLACVTATGCIETGWKLSDIKQVGLVDMASDDGKGIVGLQIWEGRASNSLFEVPFGFKINEKTKAKSVFFSSRNGGDEYIRQLGLNPDVTKRELERSLSNLSF